jgi:hypothetical protein
MHRLQNQAGITVIGLIFILVPFALIGYIVMRAVPVYIESLSVGDAINSLKKEADIKEKSRDEIYRMIRKRLDVNNITSVEKEDIDIQKTVDNVKVTVDYQTKVPLFGNVALAFSFHKNAVVH